MSITQLLEENPGNGFNKLKITSMPFKKKIFFFSEVELFLEIEVKDINLKFML
jgi:hypothetical protein